MLCGGLLWKWRIGIATAVVASFSLRDISLLRDVSDADISGCYM